MDSFNKIVSFVLGLVVVIVFLAVITGRLSPGKSFRGLGFGGRTTPTPTSMPTTAARAVSSPTPVVILTRQPTLITQRTNINAPKSIPATGSPTLLLPLLLSSLGLGVYLKGKK